jgi:hypothetical protein
MKRTKSIPEDASFEVFGDLAPNGRGDATYFRRSSRIPQATRRRYKTCIVAEVILVNALEAAGCEVLEQSFKIVRIICFIEVLRQNNIRKGSNPTSRIVMPFSIVRERYQSVV